MSDLKLDDSALPILFQESDKASLKAQTTHYRVLAVYLLLLTLSAIISFKWPDEKNGAIVAASLFCITLGLSIWQARSRATEIWYKGRAVAESVKTLSWRWVMQPEPDNKTDIDLTEQSFAEKLQELLSVNEGLRKFLRSDTGLQNSVSPTMKKIRSLSLSEKLAIYKTGRVDNQANWYEGKAEVNKRKARLWRVLAIALNLAALILLCIRIADPSWNVPVDVLATAAGAVASWTEAKKYDELKSSYALASGEIEKIKDLASRVSTKEELVKYVTDSENAFSREHTQWLARRA